MDIEKEKLIEENIRLKKELENYKNVNSNDVFELIFRNNSSVMLNIDPDTGKIIDANNKALEFYGYSYKEITNLNIKNINTATETEITQELKNAKLNKRNYFLYKHKLANGKILDVEIFSSQIKTNNKIFISNIIHEITHVSKTEIELKESQNRLYTFINSIPDIICYKDAEGRWLLANEADLELFCLSDVNYVGKTDAELAPYTNEIYKEAFINCMRTDEIAWQNAVLTKEIERIPTVNGNVKVYDVIKIPLFNPDKTRKALAVIGRDITNLDEIQKSLIDAKEKAEESNLLKTKFINNMSHEIRTPMNGIIGFSGMLNQENLSKDRIRFYTNIIKNSGEQLLRIIDDLLEISQLETKKVKLFETQFCLNNLLLELFSIFQIKAKEKNLSLYLKNGLNDNNCGIVTDKSVLNKIISNLLENAIKYTNTGYVEVGYFIENNNIKIYVKDTGFGIFDKNFDKIFEKFSQEENTLNDKQRGLGLGLAIVKENAELLGGKIEIESIKEKGSVFYLSIPYKPINIDDSKNTVKNNHNNDKEFKILIVEDEQVNYLYLEALLFTFNNSLKITHAKNGLDAIDLCDENNYDLVLMDIKMPVMNGFEATKILKGKYPQLNIVAQTAYSSSEDIEKANRAGFDDFISKPINRLKMIKLVENYMKI
ncbi:MAG: response regulator [Bacteroidales bacterium]|nr:response regulator [Bacteroidales bacterium]